VRLQNSEHTISFVMSVRPHETTRLPSGPIFMKIQVSLKSDQNNILHMKTYVHL